MPAPDLQLCTAADVIKFCFANDVAAARTLANVGAWDDALLTDAIKAASADVEVACGNKFQLGYTADVTVYPFHLRRLAAVRAGFHFWVMYGKGMACPENLKREVTDPDLQLIRDGKGGTGTQKPAPSRITSALPDTTFGGRVPRMSLRGFEGY